MKNQPIPKTSQCSSGLRGLLHHLLGRSGVAAPIKSKIVKVWDARCDAYRDVDLYDRNDPLWPTARELYLFTKSRSRKAAA